MESEFAKLLERIEQSCKKAGIEPSRGHGAMCGLTDEQADACEEIASANPNHDASNPNHRWNGHKPVYYECGICDHCHPWDWNGDCRDDANRLTNQQLDDRHGQDGYELRPMAERV